MMTTHQQLPTFTPPISRLYPTPLQQLHYQQANPMLHSQQGILPHAPLQVGNPTLLQQQLAWQQLQHQQWQQCNVFGGKINPGNLQKKWCSHQLPG